MEPYRPDWYDELTTPLKQRTFTDKHIAKIEQRIKEEEKRRERKKRTVVYGTAAAAILCVIAAVLLLQQPHLSGPEPVQTTPPEDAAQDEIDMPKFINPEDESLTEVDEEERPEEVQIRLRTSAYAYAEQPDFAWDLGSQEPYHIPADGTYELVEDGGGLFVKIRDGETEYWLNRWYIEDVRDSATVDEVEPYEMIVFESSMFYAYPDQEAPAGYELDAGRVVQVHKRYRNWAAVEIMLYAEPMTGEKWIPADTLIPYDDYLANEGHLLVDWDGSYMYDMNNGQPKQLIDRTMPIIVSGEKDDMYIADAPGGMSGLVRKEDFIPNPFVEHQATYMGLRSEAKLAFDRFREMRDDGELRGMSPLDVYKMYYHAVMMDDPELIYDLYIEEGGDLPDRDAYLEDWRSMDEGTRQRTIDQAMELKDIEVEQRLFEADNMALVLPVGADLGESWFFRLLRDEEGIWKVSWLPRQ